MDRCVADIISSAVELLERTAKFQCEMLFCFAVQVPTRVVEAELYCAARTAASTRMMWEVTEGWLALAAGSTPRRSEASYTAACGDSADVSIRQANTGLRPVMKNRLYLVRNTLNSPENAMPMESRRSEHPIRRCAIRQDY